MINLFEGLEKYGFDNAEDADLFSEKAKTQGAAVEEVEVKPESLLYFKEYECPSCDKKFKNAVVKQRMARYIKSDTDLRMYYEPIDPMHYDVILCTHCGYAALSATFNRLTSRQMEKVKEGITAKYRPHEYPLLLTLDQAIERYKIALLNSHVKGGKDGEKAYICLKLGWLYRVVPDVEREKAFLENAVKGFERAYTNERFPVCGIDEVTLIYLLADVSRRIGHNDVALRYLGRIFENRGVSQRIKDKALTIRDMIREAEKAKASPPPPPPQSQQPPPQPQPQSSVKPKKFMTLPSIVKRK